MVRFDLGRILEILNMVDDIILCMYAVRQTLKSMGLYRRKTESDLLEVASFLSDQLEGQGRLRGYSSCTVLTASTSRLNQRRVKL